MVKNLNTIDRSERVRIGKHVPDEQAVNTIIINASSNVIQASQEGLYIAPIRVDNTFASNALCYDILTNEIIDSGKTVEPQDLQGVTETGNTTTETVEFNNTTTSFVTSSNVGIANSNPQHELSVGGDAYISGNLTVLGETTMISSENLRVRDAIIEIGENNTDSDFTFDLGLVMSRPGSNVAAAFIESSNEYVIGYTQNSASDRYITIDSSNLIQMHVYGDIDANSFVGDGTFISNVVKFSDLSANLVVIRNEMAANTVTLRADILSNANVLRDEMAANTVTLRADILSNANVLRDEMAANTVTLRADLTSNANILRDEMAANTVTLRADLTSNANILRGEMAANTVTLRADLTSNANILRGEMAANTVTLRADLASNANILRGEMAANTVTLRADLASNVNILRGEMAANTVTIRNEMAANTLSLRSDLQSNANILRGEMAANTITLRNEIALKSNIHNPVFTGIITGDGGAISNISLQHVTEYGNSSDRTITLSNTLALVTSGNVGINTPTPQKMLHVAGEILADDDITGVDFYGDDATFTGGLTVSGDTLFYGNLEVRGNTTYLSTQNLLVEDPILALGANNTTSSLDTGVILVYQGDSNVAFGYRGASNEFIISHTLSSPDDSELTPDTSNAINVHVYGDVTADTFRGDGGFLSNIASNLQQISLNGNVTSETIYLQQDITGLDVSNNVLVGGNVTASSFIGDGGFLSNIASNLHQIALNGNVTSETIYLQQDITGLDVSNNVLVGGNVTASSFIGDGGLLSNIASNLQQIALNGNVTSETIYLQQDITGLDVSNNVLVGGNVTATSFIGDGGFLSNIASNLEQIALNGNVTTQTLYLNNPITGLEVGSNLVVNGNVYASYFVGDGSNLSGIVTDLQSVTDNGNVTSNTVQFTNSNTSLITESNVGIANANPIHTLDIGDKVSIDINDSNVLSVKGNIFASKLTLGTVSIYGSGSINPTQTLNLYNEITSMNAASNVIVNGNVTAITFIGDGSNLTGLVKYSELESNISVIEANLSVISSDLSDNSSRIGVISSDLSDNSSRIGVISSDLSDNSSRIGVISSDLSDNSSRIGVISSDLSDNSSRIGVISSDLSDNSSRIGVISSDLSDNSSRIGVISSDLSDNSSRIGVISSDLSDNSSRIGVISSDLSDNSSRIGVISSDLSDNSSRISTLEIGDTTISGLKTFSEEVIFESNIHVKGDLLVANTVNMIVSDPIIELGANNLNTNDLGIVMTRHGVSDSNVALFYDESEDTFNIGYTSNSAYDSVINAEAGNPITMNVHGNIEATTNIQASNIMTNYSNISGRLDLGSIYSQNMICQTRQYEYSSSTATYVTSGTLTLLTCAFTPKYSNSKILIELSCPVETTATYFNIFVDRGSSRITSNPGSYGIISYNSGTSLGGHFIHTGIGYDLPSTTSSINYNVVAEYGSGDTLTILTQSGKILVFIHELCQ